MKSEKPSAMPMPGMQMDMSHRWETGSAEHVPNVPKCTKKCGTISTKKNRKNEKSKNGVFRVFFGVSVHPLTKNPEFQEKFSESEIL